jgi:hypothetical protein
MTAGYSWAWPTLFLLGAYHGLNPGMGWLFAVALGMQERSGSAVARALPPIALGHVLAIGLVVGFAAVILTILPLGYVKIAVAVLLLAFGLQRLFRKYHPRWGGMQVGFRDLTIWSFLMASAHGAGFMVVPVLLGMQSPGHQMHVSLPHGPLVNGMAVLVHTCGYLIVTGLAAWLVYEKFGLALLRSSWLNFDLVWSIALIATAGLALLT